MNYSIEYSPLCDTDKELYREYLAAVKNVKGYACSACVGSGTGANLGRRVEAGVENGEGVGGETGVTRGLDGGGNAAVFAVTCPSGGGTDGEPREEGLVVAGVAQDFELVGCGGAVGSRSDNVCGFQRSGGSVEPDAVKGKHYEKNRKRKERQRRARQGGDAEVTGTVPVRPGSPWRSARVERNKKARELHGVQVRGFSSLSVVEQQGLKASYADRLKAENELGAFRAKQRLELEKSKSMEQLKKRQETFLMSQTEMNKVRAEKAFATLAQTDNVPGGMGFAKTVVSGSDGSPVFGGAGSGTISPNSSISLAEIHAMQKRELEYAHKVEKLEARMEKFKLLQPEMYKELGFLHALPPTVGTGVTVDENGSPIGDYGDGFAGYLGDDGRFHFGENYDNY